MSAAQPEIQSRGLQTTAGRLLLTSLQLVAFWPVWSWWMERMMSFPENRAGLASLAAVMVFLVGYTMSGKLRAPRLAVPTVLLFCFAATHPFVHPLVGAGIAVLSVGWTILSMLSGASYGILGLMLLSLPVIPSLQTYVGYPLRVVVAAVAAPWIRLAGFTVEREGVCLRWGNELVMVDEPCSGIKMLWAGLALACALSAMHGLNGRRTMLAVGAAAMAVVGANILRCCALFYAESGMVVLPLWGHEAVGILVFGIFAGALAWGIARLKGRQTCAPA
ncbi:MAG: exosortase/archaeosortase family protein [Candidatus Sumerlaeaceae bacterium]|nr:exosortase/archaeosortase family protein [Candidatus Sumerlaeaceae bacterium]